MTNITWSDELGNRSRRNGLLIIPPGEQAYWFCGGSDKNVRVVVSRYNKNGKWSHTTYELEVADGVRAQPVTQGWESGKWREGFAKALELNPMALWSDIAATLQIPEETLVGLKPEKGSGKFIVIPNGPPPGQSSEAE
jgi:hypothetical protein